MGKLLQKLVQGIVPSWLTKVKSSKETSPKKLLPSCSTSMATTTTAASSLDASSTPALHGISHDEKDELACSTEGAFTSTNPSSSKPEQNSHQKKGDRKKGNHHDHYQQHKEEPHPALADIRGDHEEHHQHQRHHQDPYPALVDMYGDHGTCKKQSSTSSSTSSSFRKVAGPSIDNGHGRHAGQVSVVEAEAAKISGQQQRQGNGAHDCSILISAKEMDYSHHHHHEYDDNHHQKDKAPHHQPLLNEQDLIAIGIKPRHGEKEKRMPYSDHGGTREHDLHEAEDGYKNILGQMFNYHEFLGIKRKSDSLSEDEEDDEGDEEGDKGQSEDDYINYWKRRKGEMRGGLMSIELPEGICSIVGNGKVVVKQSMDPQQALWESMVEMIVGNGLWDWGNLEFLLFCYLSLNEPHLHPIIQSSFLQVLRDLNRTPY